MAMLNNQMIGIIRWSSNIFANHRGFFCFPKPHPSPSDVGASRSAFPSFIEGVVASCIGSFSWDLFILISTSG